MEFESHRLWFVWLKKANKGIVEVKDKSRVTYCGGRLVDRHPVVATGQFPTMINDTLAPVR